MIDKKQFIKIIESTQGYEKEIDKWNDFGIQIFEMPIVELQGQLFDTFLECLFNREGIDWIYWWLYEKISVINGEPLQAYNEDGSIIPTDTADDLWNIVKKYRK